MSTAGRRQHGGHKTSSIPRPVDPTRPRPRVRPGANDDTRFGDFTRPIPRDKQLVKGKGKRGVITIGAGVVTAALIAALFVLPVQAWLRQQDDIDSKQRELAALQLANADLLDEVAMLQTPAGVEQAARQEIGYVKRGEIRLTVLTAPQAPITMPDGWPYDQIAQIVAARSAVAVNP